MDFYTLYPSEEEARKAASDILSSVRKDWASSQGEVHQVRRVEIEVNDLRKVMPRSCLRGITVHAQGPCSRGEDRGKTECYRDYNLAWQVAAEEPVRGGD